MCMCDKRTRGGTGWQDPSVGLLRREGESEGEGGGMNQANRVEYNIVCAIYLLSLLLLLLSRVLIVLQREMPPFEVKAAAAETHDERGLSLTADWRQRACCSLEYLVGPVKFDGAAIQRPLRISRLDWQTTQHQLDRGVVGEEQKDINSKSGDLVGLSWRGWINEGKKRNKRINIVQAKSSVKDDNYVARDCVCGREREGERERERARERGGAETRGELFNSMGVNCSFSVCFCYLLFRFLYYFFGSSDANGNAAAQMSLWCWRMENTSTRAEELSSRMPNMETVGQDDTYLCPRWFVVMYGAFFFLCGGGEEISWIIMLIWLRQPKKNPSKSQWILKKRLTQDFCVKKTRDDLSREGVTLITSVFWVVVGSLMGGLERWRTFRRRERERERERERKLIDKLPQPCCERESSRSWQISAHRLNLSLPLQLASCTGYVDYGPASIDQETQDRDRTDSLANGKTEIDRKRKKIIEWKERSDSRLYDCRELKKGTGRSLIKGLTEGLGIGRSTERRRGATDLGLNSDRRCRVLCCSSSCCCCTYNSLITRLIQWVLIILCSLGMEFSFLFFFSFGEVVCPARRSGEGNLYVIFGLCERRKVEEKKKNMRFSPQLHSVGEKDCLPRHVRSPADQPSTQLAERMVADQPAASGSRRRSDRRRRSWNSGKNFLTAAIHIWFIDFESCIYIRHPFACRCVYVEKLYVVQSFELPYFFFLFCNNNKVRSRRRALHTVCGGETTNSLAYPSPPYIPNGKYKYRGKKKHILKCLALSCAQTLIIPHQTWERRDTSAPQNASHAAEEVALRQLTTEINTDFLLKNNEDRYVTMHQKKKKKRASVCNNRQERNCSHKRQERRFGRGRAEILECACGVALMEINVKGARSLPMIHYNHPAHRHDRPGMVCKGARCSKTKKKESLHASVRSWCKPCFSTPFVAHEQADLTMASVHGLKLPPIWLVLMLHDDERNKTRDSSTKVFLYSSIKPEIRLCGYGWGQGAHANFPCVNDVGGNLKRQMRFCWVVRSQSVADDISDRLPDERERECVCVCACVRATGFLVGASKIRCNSLCFVRPHQIIILLSLNPRRRLLNCRASIWATHTHAHTVFPFLFSVQSTARFGLRRAYTIIITKFRRRKKPQRGFSNMYNGITHTKISHGMRRTRRRLGPGCVLYVVP
ncbi:hypothetical protein VP01_2596g2 [Puccinia sorghi]|uniref:Uncharacterized protein n=1 Tax=Puccinia sorghi TaxID=27349 RepID=A0A0L6V4T7_9BASI|nr:hypothetical protein VP01_2596g2 [Puccinia sorghi]